MGAKVAALHAQVHTAVLADLIFSVLIRRPSQYYFAISVLVPSTGTAGHTVACRSAIAQLCRSTLVHAARSGQPPP
eukprot:3941323-Rhodomonas_salina.1